MRLRKRFGDDGRTPRTHIYNLKLPKKGYLHHRFGLDLKSTTKIVQQPQTSGVNFPEWWVNLNRNSQI